MLTLLERTINYIVKYTTKVVGISIMSVCLVPDSITLLHVVGKPDISND